MKFLAFHKLGENRQSPRVWIESQRLDSLGFSPGIGFTVEPLANKVRLRPAILADNHVSSRISGGHKRPLIDIANRQLLASLVDFAEIKIAAAFRQIDVTPSTRAFHIRRRLQAKPPFETIEVFAGGGTLSAAIGANPNFHLVASGSISPRTERRRFWRLGFRPGEVIMIKADSQKSRNRLAARSAKNRKKIQRHGGSILIP